jgi:hypothetical protein
MSDDVIRVPARSLKEQFSRGSEAWKEQSDPIFRFWTEGDWWGFPFFSLSASRYFGDKGTLCLYWPLGTVVITGPKALDFLRRLLRPPGNITQVRRERHPVGDNAVELRAFARRSGKLVVSPVENVVVDK